jgi:hypothetical protein
VLAHDMLHGGLEVCVSGAYLSISAQLRRYTGEALALCSCCLRASRRFSTDFSRSPFSSFMSWMVLSRLPSRLCRRRTSARGLLPIWDAISATDEQHKNVAGQCHHAPTSPAWWASFLARMDEMFLPRVWLARCFHGAVAVTSEKPAVADSYIISFKAWMVRHQY